MSNTKPTMGLLWIVALAAPAALTGCKGWDPGWWNFFDPSRPLRSPDQPRINPIFETIGPTDQTEVLVPGAEQPAPEDLEYVEADYVIGPTDLLRIGVLDLLAEGLETVVEREVSHSGYIDLPLLEDRILAAGLTQDELVQKIKEAYRPNILKDATVSVVVVIPRQSIFSILGAVVRPGTYSIMRRDFTLLEALALAGDISQVNIDWLYVIRAKKEEKAVKPPEGVEALPPLPEIPETAPATQETRPARRVEEEMKELEKFIPGAVMRPGGPAPQAGDERVYLSAVNTAPAPASTGSAPADLEKATVTYKWVYSSGRWIRVPQEVATQPAVPVPERLLAPAEREKDPFGWIQHDLAKKKRIIAVNLNKLKAGDPRMNIIIRPKDIVHVPTLQIGEFYVMGEVLRPGVYSLTGRKVTAKQAVAAAGNLGPLSWPNNSILIRRIGRDQEQIQQLKLNDIMAGKEPDIFLKPDDTIAVGTYWAAPFMAVWRNAFRMTYGFGFIYDRNYSEMEFEIPIFFPHKGYRLY